MSWWFVVKREFGRYPGFMWLLLVSFLFFVLDFVTTWLNRDILVFVEVNPLFRLTGSLFFPVLLNFVLGWLLWRVYCRVSPAKRFFVILFLLSVIVVRGFAIHNALVWVSLDDSVRVSSAVAVSSSVIWFNLLLIYLIVFGPVFFGMVGFFVWKLDHVVVEKGAFLPGEKP